MLAAPSTHRWTNYLTWMLAPFFAKWWAAFTGVVSVLAFFGAPEEGWQVSKVWITALVFVLVSVTFLALSSVTRGWDLYRSTQVPLSVLSVSRDSDSASGLLLVLAGYLDEVEGTMLDVRRLYQSAELPFCIVRVMTRTQDGHYQAEALWTAPAHIKAFKRREFEVGDHPVRRTLTYDQVRKLAEGPADVV